MKWIIVLCGLGAISIVTTSLLILGGYSPLTIFLTSLAIGGTLGYISGRLGYEF